MINLVISIKCPCCGYESSSFRGFKCPVCGCSTDVIHEYKLKKDMVEEGIWVYKNILPKPKIMISLGEGLTPLVKSLNLFKDTLVYFKDEGRNPTGSFRDRAAALIISDALSIGVRRVILASDGNMGASVSAYASRAGLPVTVYVPSWTDEEKILLMKAYGANVIIKNDYLDNLLEYVEIRARKQNLYDASSIHNILSMEGLKTIIYEIIDQLGRTPNRVILPLGSGLTLLSIYHGLEEMRRNNIIDRFPKLVGVETCGNPIYSSYLGIKTKCSEEPLPGLAYKKPVIMDKVIEILEKHGETIVVSKREVLEAAKNLARREGLFVEPSSAVALAGALKTSVEDYTVILLTGHGLKGPSPYVEARRIRTNIFPGSTKSIILNIIEQYPGLTGYEIWKKLGIKISVQAVYQHLHDLENKGLIRSVIIDGLKRYYLMSK